MRRSVTPGIGIAAILVFAACSPDSPVREPLAPTTPLLAAGSQCSGSLASEIAKQQKLIFTGNELTQIEAKFKIIKNQCPNADVTLMQYLQQTIDFSTASKAGQIVSLWSSVIMFHDGVEDFLRDASVLGSTGGAKVIAPGQSMTTFDGLAGVKLDPNTRVNGETSITGLHLFTFTPVTDLLECPSTSLDLTGRCYLLEVYPHDAAWTPKVTVGLCPMFHGQGTHAVGHEDNGFGTELLPSGDPFPVHCAQIASAMDSWLGRKAGPLGRMVARAYDYLRPRPLFAIDAGESGLLGEFSLIGGVLPIVFDDNFDNENDGPFVSGTPTIGDNWEVVVEHPGTVEIMNGYESLLASVYGKVLVVSQALGNCADCPTVSVLGTRVSNDTLETIGSYQITWSSLQAKPSVKEAPFVVRSHNGVEIARLAYVSVGPAKEFRYNGTQVSLNGTPVNWVEDVHQDFRLTVNLDTKSGTDWTTSLEIKINGVYTLVASGTMPPGSSLRKFGYYLDGIDAGIIATDLFHARRLADN